MFGLDGVRFGSIRSLIIDEDPLPDLNIVYSRVIRAEQHLTNMRSDEIKQDAVGFLVRTESSPSALSSSVAATTYRNRDVNRYCTHCKRTGHEASECFLLHGYPDWFLEQQQQRSASRGTSGPTNRGLEVVFPILVDVAAVVLYLHLHLLLLHLFPLLRIKLQL